jgi:hypothetical protein
MGVDIGICKYIPEREEKIAELNILSKLKGIMGETAKKERYEIYEKMHKEISEVFEDDAENPAQHFKGHRMFNLWYRINLKTFDLEFSFYDLYGETRVTPDIITDIIHDLKMLLEIKENDNRERMEYLLKFFEYLVNNNLMIYPA